MKTLLEFATEDVLTSLLIKERAKCRRRNRSDKHHTLSKDCDLLELSSRKMLSRIMPPRRLWVRPKKRKRLDNGAVDTSKNAEKALHLTIKRNRKRQKEGVAFGYLDELDAFIERIKKRLSSESLQFDKPLLLPIYKDKEKKDDRSFLVTCRPLSVYLKLEDKIVLALTSRYLTRYFDKYLHSNILSYRRARDFNGKKHYVTDFNDGIQLIREFREAHDAETIYASDCDIKKFYDIIPHQVVRDCFEKILGKSYLDEEGKRQVMRVLEAYLASYNFYTNAWMEAQQHDRVFYKVRRKFHDKDKKNSYQFKWVDDIWEKPEEEYKKLGVPQGGALSLLIANIVLNDVDEVFTANFDDNRMLFIRYCDDMILLHTDEKECRRLMEQYAESLKSHGLYYHDFKDVSNCTRSEFWKLKSHFPFCWEDGEGNRNRYIGFVGYEIRRDGRMRLRKSNIERFVEKFNRLWYSIRRYGKTHTKEEFLAHQEQTLDKALDGVNFYKGFDLEVFKKGSQFRYLRKLKKRTKQRYPIKQKSE